MKLVFSIIVILLSTSEAIAAVPKWFVKVPQSRYYSYYTGVGEAKQLSASKRMAIADALKDVINRGGIKVSSDFNWERHNGHLNNKDTDLEKIIDDINVGGESRRIGGLEQVDGAYEEIAGWYRFYVLLRLPKQESSNLTKVGKRIDTLWHSLLIPGWGQLRRGRSTEGKLFLTSCLFTLTGAAALQVLEEVNPELEEEDLKNIKKYRRKLLHAASYIYVINVLDAFLFGGQAEPHFMVTVSSDHIGVNAFRRFP